ncbi:phage GP46 family protein, partial [Xanthobacter sp. DSM 24535]|uniref:phage GP46 family protein n=1 Tax=Roseixanthobacter psychrophilus TaxID=3119917 RepID=UPI0037287848
VTELNEPTSLVERRGWAGDALDAEGRLIGSRLWLLDRAKENELTRMMGEEWTREAYAWVEGETNTAPEIEVAWVRAGVLGVRARVDGRAIAVSRRVGAEAA